MRKQRNEFMQEANVYSDDNLRIFPVSPYTESHAPDNISKDKSRHGFFTDLLCDLHLMTDSENQRPVLNPRAIAVWVVIIGLFLFALAAAFYWNSRIYYQLGVQDKEKAYNEKRIEALEKALKIKNLEEQTNAGTPTEEEKEN